MTNRGSMNWLSDALLIAGVPAFIYLFTLAFEVSFAREFGVPFQFVGVTWTSGFILGTLLLGIIGTVFVICLFASSFISRDKERPRYLRALDSVPGLLMLVESGAFLVMNWRRSMIVIGLIGFVMGVFSSLIIRRDRKLHSILNPEGAQRLRATFVIAMWLLLGVNTAWMTGAVLARTQTQFYVVQSSPETIVLGIWGDTVVSAPFDRKTRTVRREFIITKTSEHSPLDIREERIGPLRTETSP